MKEENGRWKPGVVRQRSSAYGGGDNKAMTPQEVKDRLGNTVTWHGTEYILNAYILRKNFETKRSVIIARLEEVE